ncbi:MAG: epoxyqueuosine reductase QueH [Lawsonibacter sp.]
MKILLHACCAPCANRPIEVLRQEGMEVTGFWYNPNIHPYTEYQARKATLEAYAKEIGMKLIIGGTYDLRTFVTNVADNIDGRCTYCYRVRMEETAKYAAEHGFDGFTTSLLISPYQRHEAIVAAAEAMGKRYGVEFLNRDFRPLFRAGQEFARGHGMYMQKYCGCIFSEEDRYMAAKRRKKEVQQQIQMKQE